MLRYALEVVLDDQPGALALLAGTIGETGGDVVDIDVMERIRGRARDEITVDLPDEAAAEHLRSRLAALTGVDLEHLAPVGDFVHHLLVDSLEVARALVSEYESAGLAEALVTGVQAAFGASFAVVVLDESAKPLASAGGVPPAAVARGGGAGVRFDNGDDCLSFDLGDGATLVVGRQGWPFRSRERRELTTLARIAAERHKQLLAPS